MNKLLALISFALLAVFLGILVFKVMEVDLIIIAVIAVAMAGFDFIQSIKSNEQH
ncbi:hypothetical protein [Marinobacterium sp. xm-d-564]|uniref:hypothetical protein n=1 Tax=Marinobacterium sp. xm-d-564 TaxID=2497742 RepID=UPI001569E9EB|nr:hypothetical protein [Marinobacterium sp. xm-d-564]NRP59084.1 hypothetical protein [Marinobacterium sp. xm-d-564]